MQIFFNDERIEGIKFLIYQLQMFGFKGSLFLFDIQKNRPELLGIGIDESTAIVVQGNEFEVMGESYVIFYDGTFWSSEGSDLKNIPEKTYLF